MLSGLIVLLESHFLRNGHSSNCIVNFAKACSILVLLKIQNNVSPKNFVISLLALLKYCYWLREVWKFMLASSKSEWDISTVCSEQVIKKQC